MLWETRETNLAHRHVPQTGKVVINAAAGEALLAT